MVMPHVVIAFPDKYLELWLAYHYKHLPNLSTGIEYTPADLCFWKNKTVPKKLQRLRGHGTLPGFCCKWANTSYDFAMARLDNTHLALQNTHLTLQTHIWFFKHTFGCSKHTFGTDTDTDTDLDLSISRPPTRSLGCPHTSPTTRKGTASRTPTAPGVR